MATPIAFGERRIIRRTCIIPGCDWYHDEPFERDFTGLDPARLDEEIARRKRATVATEDLIRRHVLTHRSVDLVAIIGRLLTRKLELESALHRARRLLRETAADLDVLALDVHVTKASHIHSSECGFAKGGCLDTGALNEP